jgi:hypothetical protein
MKLDERGSVGAAFKASALSVGAQVVATGLNRSTSNATSPAEKTRLAAGALTVHT